MVPMKCHRGSQFNCGDGKGAVSACHHHPHGHHFLTKLLEGERRKMRESFGLYQAVRCVSSLLSLYQARRIP